jgi:hypothetical protein
MESIGDAEACQVLLHELIMYPVFGVSFIVAEDDEAETGIPLPQ